MEKTKLLIVDDEEQICELMGSHFKRHGFDVLTATSGKQAIDLTKINHPQVVLLDKRMPEMDGIETLEEIRKFNQDLKVIFISADELDTETESRISGLNVIGYLHKPLNIADLDAMVDNAVK
jgi:DNA-binding response OmpR family regulator